MVNKKAKLSPHTTEIPEKDTANKEDKQEKCTVYLLIRMLWRKV